MKGLFGGVALFFVGYVVTSGGFSGGSIDYDNATLEEQQAWMDKQAGKMHSAARFFLPSGGGPMALSFSLQDVETRPQAKEMQMNIKVKIPYGAKVYHTPRGPLMEKLCVSYKRTALYDANVKMIAVLKRSDNGQTLTHVAASPRQCAQYLNEV